MEMENITGWTDWLDEERVAQSGDFYIHRTTLMMKVSIDVYPTLNQKKIS